MSRSDSTSRRRTPKPDRPKDVCRASGGKLTYPRRKQALSAMNETRARDPRGNGELPVAVYRCPWCRGWHMTSKPQRPSAGS
jgi:hypothetical protein